MGLQRFKLSFLSNAVGITQANATILSNSCDNKDAKLCDRFFGTFRPCASVRLLSLQVSDIDGARMTIHVHRGKGAKMCLCPIPP